MQVDADGTFPCAQPWLYPGIGGTLYEFAPQEAKLLTIYAVRPEDAAPLSGRTRYCFARLLFKHRRCGLDGARQPVCIEWPRRATRAAATTSSCGAGPGGSSR